MPLDMLELVRDGREHWVLGGPRQLAHHRSAADDDEHVEAAQGVQGHEAARHGGLARHGVSVARVDSGSTPPTSALVPALAP